MLPAKFPLTYSQTLSTAIGSKTLKCTYVLNDRKIKGKYKYLSCLLNTSCSGTDATASDKRFQCLTTLHAKLFLLLRVLPFC